MVSIHPYFIHYYCILNVPYINIYIYIISKSFKQQQTFTNEFQCYIFTLFLIVPFSIKNF